MKRKSSRKPTKTPEKNENGVDLDQENISDEEPQEKRGRKSKEKKSKKSKSKHQDSESELEDTQNAADPLAEDEEEAEYEVEAIIDGKVVKGTKFYLIRWKGYTEESDTWEPENTLDCEDLIKEYNSKAKKNPKEASSKKKGKEKKIDQQKTEQKTWDENEDFEVGRILDVYFHKNGKRDFLVSWKGYPSSENSWEPEDNMDCKDLIEKFMQKVAKVREFEGKEMSLRVNRKPTNRLEFTMHKAERRLSKRNRGADRVHYFDAE